MQRISLLTILYFIFGAWSLQAQSVNDDTPYIQGPVYKVINAGNGPVILWEGKLAAEEQLIRESDELITVSPPGSDEPRLLVYLRDDGRLDRIVDLEYQRDDRLPVQDYPMLSTDEYIEPINITFENGMIFTYDDGNASFNLAGEELDFTGVKGSYRVKTEGFEAGVSFRTRDGKKVYHYFTVK